ncbi:hypothetical protein F5Y12DRAFT_742942 [Xylaria sp. FL1777]|nr:hypothetical protein F5Y12DRAFT_742942 [Xylaria sp. FL1777]
MFPIGIPQVPIWVNTAKPSTKTDTPCHNARLHGEVNPIVASQDREQSRLVSAENTTYSSQHKLDTEPTHATRPRSKRKRVKSFLSKALKNMRGAFLNYVSPAHEGTSFLENERRRRVVNNLRYNELGPWHEYGRLDSDTEDDKYNSHFSKKKT